MSKLKLPRVYKLSLYTTGDNPEWTYQYTWEDWEASAMNVSSDWYCDYAALNMFLTNYFIEHPECVKPYTQFKDYSLSDIKSYMKNRLLELYSDPEVRSSLHNLWFEMLCRVNNEND